MTFSSIFIPAVIITALISLVIARQHIEKRRKIPPLLIGTAQTIGEREEQEDSFSLIENESGFLAVLADGMGGFSAGKNASEFVVTTFLEEFTKNYYINPINDFLINTTYISNYNLVKMAKGEHMGTTLVAVIIKDDLLYWVSVGDSQIYLYKNKYLHPINQRHTYAITLQEACKRGEISREMARNHPKRDRLISYLGHKDFHLLDYSKTPIELSKGDKIILCSDGIYNSLSNAELLEILSSHNLQAEKDADSILERIIAKNISNQDNATVLVIEKAQ